MTEVQIKQCLLCLFWISHRDLLWTEGQEASSDKKTGLQDNVIFWREAFLLKM